MDYVHKKIRRISVSSNRQIRIPQDFCEATNIRDEVLAELLNNRLVIKPVHEGFGDFSEEILADLIQDGYSMEQLLEEFKIRKEKLKPALNDLIADAYSQDYTTVKELFSDLNENREQS
ncbi:AbrB/MazE/SpoVT family DNA-binding domain-containing protein [Gracilibacillus massiliensis]|uniref:AbrB/MazE/SpoVT family DNA-binding domain-containing protein n=1 Tax=Gracilibacillus massiliensis TaxID=1564956 RepID=UPI00071CCFA7|nr:AbrB/MazE/SpoVT family DNA-binding domain-containing protein [Gracilibacillus massiliensis]